MHVFDDHRLPIAETAPELGGRRGEAEADLRIHQFIVRVSGVEHRLDHEVIAIGEHQSGAVIRGDDVHLLEDQVQQRLQRERRRDVTRNVEQREELT